MVNRMKGAAVESVTQRDLQDRVNAITAAAHRGQTFAVRRYKSELAVYVGSDLWNELLDAAGDRGRQLVDEYAARAANAEQREAVPA